MSKKSKTEIKELLFLLTDKQKEEYILEITKIDDYKIYEYLETGMSA